MTERRALHAFVRGRVQGVGFRWATRKRAQGLELTGWVRNLVDGRVEVYAEGPEESLEALTSWLAQGPRLARVDDVAFDPSEPLAATGCDSFDSIADA